MRAILVAAILLGGCQSEAGRAISDAQQLAARDLADPGSAQFRNVAYYPNGKSVCGEINAKNRMGGYVGYRRFFVVDGAATIEQEPGVIVTDVDQLRATINSSRFNSDATTICNDLPANLRIKR